MIKDNGMAMQEFSRTTELVYSVLNILDCLDLERYAEHVKELAHTIRSTSKHLHALDIIEQNAAVAECLIRAKREINDKLNVHINN